METEEQQVEALREWWKENGRTVIIGVVIGLGSVTGWNVWRSHLESQAEAASLSYQQLVDSATRDDHADVVAQADALVSEYPDSGYAALASLVAARSAYEKDDAKGAEERLRWVIEHAERVTLKDVARLRLARVLAEKGDTSGARAMLDAVSMEELRPSVEEARGDLAILGGEADAARAAYRAALGAATLTPGGRERLQLKLEQLGPAPKGQQS